VGLHALARGDQIDDQDVKALMIDVVDRCYDHGTVCNLDGAAKGPLISPDPHLLTHGTNVIDLK
jgi:hypothetical protein